MPEETLKPGPHDMLPSLTHDETGRMGFVRNMRRLITSRLTPGHKKIYDARIKPDLEKRLGRPPQDRSEIKDALQTDTYHQTWAALLRTTQEMMWNAIIGSVDRQAEALNEKFKATHANGAQSTLRLNPDMDLPSYSSKVDNHTMPGGYHTELCENDVSTGAAYDQSLNVYMMGGMGQYNDDVGVMLSTYIDWQYPDLKPKRILDIGCSVGHSTLPYSDKFPDAEIHAIELSAPLLRYGFARAESMGKAIHFSQQNAEHTDFEDASFDLIVSHIMIHETSNKAIRRIMKECRRLLKPGGVVAHLEMLPFSKKTPLQQYLTDWDSTNNHEPFIGKMNELDMDEVLAEAGFSEDERFVEFVPIDFQKNDKGSLDYAHLIGTERHIFGARKSSTSD